MVREKMGMANALQQHSMLLAYFKYVLVSN